MTGRNGGWAAFFILLCAGALAPAQTMGCGAPAEQVAIFLNERLTHWRQRLNLGEWQISIVTTRRDDLKPKTIGKIRWDKRNKTAVIEVLDAADYTLPRAAMLDDMELTVVHELVHLELASLPRSEASRSSEEHAVNRIAEALVRLDRRRD